MVCTVHELGLYPRKQGLIVRLYCTALSDYLEQAFFPRKKCGDFGGLVYVLGWIWGYHLCPSLLFSGHVCAVTVQRSVFSVCAYDIQFNPIYRATTPVGYHARSSAATTSRAITPQSSSPGYSTTPAGSSHPFIGYLEEWFTLSGRFTSLFALGTLFPISREPKARSYFSPALRKQVTPINSTDSP